MKGTERHPAAKLCAGCGKPFNGVRKPRAAGTHVFIAFQPGPEGASHVSTPPSYLCGACRDTAKRNGAFRLPGIQALSEATEALFYAEAQGVAQ